MGDWKATNHPQPIGDGKWQLHNIVNDPGQNHDLASQHPDILQKMISGYETYAKNVGVVVPRGEEYSIALGIATPPLNQSEVTITSKDISPAEFSNKSLDGKFVSKRGRAGRRHGRARPVHELRHGEPLGVRVARPWASARHAGRSPAGGVAVPLCFCRIARGWLDHPRVRRSRSQSRRYMSCNGGADRDVHNDAGPDRCVRRRLALGRVRWSTAPRAASTERIARRLGGHRRGASRRGVAAARRRRTGASRSGERLAAPAQALGGGARVRARRRDHGHDRGAGGAARPGSERRRVPRGQRDHRVPDGDAVAGVYAGPVAGTVTDEVVPVLGEAHDDRGPVLLAWDQAEEAARNPGSGDNVVFHEFAHKLDMRDDIVDGTPPLERRAT